MGKYESRRKAEVAETIQLGSDILGPGWIPTRPPRNKKPPSGGFLLPLFINCPLKGRTSFLSLCL